MGRFSLDEGTSRSKRKNSSNEEEEELKKRSCGRTEGENLAPEEEESDEIGDELEEEEDVEETRIDGSFRRGNNDREFNFSIDADVLDCSICFEPLRPPIFQCKNGHIACSYCCPKLLNRCHVCSEPIGLWRCIALEKVIQSIKSPCQNARYGCTAIISFADKASHEECCSHAALFCPISNCTFSGSKRLLFVHARCKHYNITMKFSYDQPFVINLEKQKRFMVLLGEDGYFFLLLNNSFETFAGNVLSVICVAPDSPACEFSYELKAESRGGEKFQLSRQFCFPWPVNHSSLSPDGKLIVIVGDNPEGIIVDSQSGKTIHDLRGHLDFSFASAWNPDGRTFATGNQDKTCRVWDVRNPSKSVAILRANLGAIRSIRFTSDGRFMAMAEPADFVHVFDVRGGYEKQQELDFFGEISGMSFSPDTETLFIGVWDRTYGSLLQYRRRRNFSYYDSLV